MKKALVCGAGGFIGSHLVKRLKKEGYWVRGIDIKKPEFSESVADEFFILDLKDFSNCIKSLSLDSKDDIFDEVYQLSADMGGAGYIFIEENDFDIMSNSALINLNFSRLYNRYKKIFFSSSACVYPEEMQKNTENIELKEHMAYPANPDSEYGWEKLFSERLFMSLCKNKGVEIRIGRFHNIYGPEGTWQGGKEKVPAAICRKISDLSTGGGEIEGWGDGEQTRSFLYIDECGEGVRRLMDSDCKDPVNIGSDEMISINELALMVANISGKKVSIKNIDGPLGVRGRNSDNNLIKEKLNWSPNYPLKNGIEKTYKWIEEKVLEDRKNNK
jgi:nucleoside-diphosphate-sugar epimerase